MNQYIQVDYKSESIPYGIVHSTAYCLLVPTLIYALNNRLICLLVPTFKHVFKCNIVC